MSKNNEIRHQHLQDDEQREIQNTIHDVNKNAVDTSYQNTAIKYAVKTSNNTHNLPLNSDTTNDVDIINANTNFQSVQQHQDMTQAENSVKLREVETFEDLRQPPILNVNSCETEQVLNRSNLTQINSFNQVNPNVRNRMAPEINSRKSSLDSLAQSSILRNYRNASVNQINNNETSTNATPHTSRSQSDMFQIPIIGYEIMEERARFTIYKLRIDDPRTGLSWMVFRRYTDFVRLYSKLKVYHPNINLPLPGKRWFKDNFDPIFLDDRVRGLQIFVNVVIRKLYNDGIVRDFFCLDEPPPVCDAEPESLALFGALEDTVGALKSQIRQKEETIEILKKKVFYLEEKMKECQICNPDGASSINSNIEKLSVTSSIRS